MLLVQTYLAKSRIHGLGVFASKAIPKGTRVWRFIEGFDRAYTPKQFARLPKPAQDFIRHHGYRVDGEILLTADHDHHINHSDHANTHWRNGHIVACRDIRKGEEITNDYRLLDQAFCAAFLRKMPKPNGKAANGHAGANGHSKTNGHAKANGHAKTNGHAKANGHAATSGHGKSNGHATEGLDDGTAWRVATATVGTSARPARR